VPDGFGSLEEYLRLVEQLPDWAEGIPVGAKGRNGPRFAKVELPIEHVPGGFINEPLPKPRTEPCKRKPKKVEPKQLDLEDAINTASNKSKPLVPDRSEAERFLVTLDPTTTEFTFQIFDDNHDRKAAAEGKDKFARVLNGTLARHWRALCRFNALGAGIYVTINRTDLKGRQIENIVEVRWLFADLDGAPVPNGCPPTVMRVESSAGKWHLYFRPGDRALAAFESAQRAIAAYCHGDAVHDLPRVLRLPGFIHRKVKEGVASPPFMTRIAEIDESARAVTIDDFPAAAPKSNGGADDLLDEMEADAGLGHGEESPYAALNTLALAKP
jgi:hypothetical protein